MVRYFMRIVTFMAIVAVAFWSWAQGLRMIRIDPAGESTQVFLSYMDATAEDSFARMFEIPNYQDYKPYALLLTNGSGQAIVSVTIRWTGRSAEKTIIHDSSTGSLLKGAPGGTSSMTTFGLPSRQSQVQMSGSYSSADGPVVLAVGERMLVAPGLLVSESLAKLRGRAGGSSSMPPTLRSADDISATLDAVVLEDGTVLGPDASRTVDGLLARKAAIDGVVRAVHIAEQNGMDGVEALRILANTQATRDQGPEVRQQSMIARTLMMSRQWKEQLATMEALQLPPFHRK
jgi:hypothetical protein